MKLNGIVGKGSGKLGASVFAISGGEQIVRQYNPQVANPNTDAQVAQRAKLKLMSQLAAALAPAIAFKKQGLVSARNQFVSANIGLCTFTNNEAKVSMQNLDLTGGKSLLPDLVTAEPAGGKVGVNLASPASADITAVVYVMASHDDDEQINLVDVVAVTEAGANRSFAGEVAAPSDSAIIYAYGVKSASAGSGITYNDSAILAQGQEAFLDVVKKLISSASSFTETKATSMSI